MERIFLVIFLIIIILCIIFYFLNVFLENTKKDKKSKKSIKEIFDNDNYILPKKIYGYWDNLDENKLIQKFLENWRKKIPDSWEIIIIDKNSVRDYVSSEFMEKYGNLESFRFADFLRLELLQNNGGVWMDISTLIITSDFLDTYRNEMINKKYDVYLYEYPSKTVDKNNPYLENWFIMAPKNSRFINDLYTEFNKSFEMGFLEYKNKVLLPSGTNLAQTIGYDKDTYLMQHAIINYLIHTGKEYNINIKNALNSMFRLQDKFNWNHDDFINYILENDIKNDDIYAIKFIGTSRNSIQNIGEDKFIERMDRI
jgi:preprotein translocase subunit YajC